MARRTRDQSQIFRSTSGHEWSTTVPVHTGRKHTCSRVSSTISISARTQNLSLPQKHGPDSMSFCKWSSAACIQSENLDLTKASRFCPWPGRDGELTLNPCTANAWDKKDTSKGAPPYPMQDETGKPRTHIDVQSVSGHTDQS